MAAVVADTHAAVWYLLNSTRKVCPPPHSEQWMRRLRRATPIYIPSISLVEVVYLVEKGKLPAVVLDRLTNAFSEPDSGFVVAPLNLSVVRAVVRLQEMAAPVLRGRGRKVRVWKLDDRVA